jgi:hypothetical protein
VPARREPSAEAVGRRWAKAKGGSAPWQSARPAAWLAIRCKRLLAYEKRFEVEVSSKLVGGYAKPRMAP